MRSLLSAKKAKSERRKTRRRRKRKRKKSTRKNLTTAIVEKEKGITTVLRIVR
jgi:hypothetical protein